MSVKEDVFEILEQRIELYERKVASFDNFGNTHNSKELLAHAINIERLSELRSVKTDLTYSIRWKK